MFESMDHDDLTRMIVTLWSIWHARRKLIHEDIQQSPAATHAFIDSFLRDLGSTSSEPKEKKGGSTIEKVRGWLPPPADMCKVNVDGAVARSQQRGAVGAVCRSRSGAFQGASAVVFEGITHPGCLEALACREGVALATDLNMGATMVASDCLEVVQGLRQGKNLGLFSHILQETEAMAKNHGGTSFCHEGRRFNVDAHKLARLATTLPVGRHVWFGTPPEGLNLPVNIVPIVE
jgi:ribonuclease HI